MWVAQPAAAEAESRWRRGLVFSQRLRPLQGRFWVFAAFEKFNTLACATKRRGGRASR